MEKEHYHKHFLIPEIGEIGQEKLKNAKVLVVGAGGLGCPILQYLTAAGIGNIGIVDGDIVQQSNLQRQILYSITDVGLPKVDVAKKRLELLNPFVSVQAFPVFLSKENALTIFKKFDLIVDATDNFATRYLINDAAILSHNPVVYGSVFNFEGQVAVFNYKNGGTYRCLFPNPPNMPANEFGVVGVLSGIIGCLQANEVIKIVCGLDDVLCSKILNFNILTFNKRVLRFKRTEQANVLRLQEKY